MRLYFAPRTRAIRPRWLLEELEVPYELVSVDLSKGEGRTPSHLALNPLGEVPVLVDGDLTLFQSTAICVYLADRFPEKGMAPSLTSPDRGPYLQWTLFSEMTIEPPVLEHFHDAQLPAEARGDLSKPRARLDEALGVLDRRLAGRDFLVGNSFTTADLVTVSILHLGNTLGLLERHPRIREYVQRQTQRAAVRRALTGTR